MFDNYSKRNEKRKYFKHFSNEKERHMLGIDEDDTEIAYSDADELPESLHINDLSDLFDWDDM